MSAPARQFRGLSIHGSAETEVASRPTPERVRGGATTTTMGGRNAIDTISIEASSGLVYDLDNSGFDLETKSRALLGLTTDFDVLFCGLESSGYEFVFAERVRVRIELQTHLDGGKNMADMDEAGYGYTCTCAVFRARADVACQHIFVSLPQVLLREPALSSHGLLFEGLANMGKYLVASRSAPGSTQLRLSSFPDSTHQRWTHAGIFTDRTASLQNYGDDDTTRSRGATQLAVFPFRGERRWYESDAEGTGHSLSI